MLSYQHAYHAGSAADVHKHAIFCLLLEHLTKKDKPFCVIDLYAGEGDYGLATPEAQKTGEHQDGIARLWGQDVPPALGTYMEILRGLNPTGALARYPGSPAIARAFLRANDQLLLNELHSGAYPILERWARRDPRIAVHKRDGLEALIALTPPKIRRGLVLVDPSYEVKTEYSDIPEKLAQSATKWREGTYAVWYPILKEKRHMVLLDGLKAWVDGDIFVCELGLNPDKGEEGFTGLRGTGVAVINPPWQFDSQMRDLGPWLASALQQGKHTTRWLKRAEA